MANLYARMYNEFIDRAADIQAYLSGAYMSRYQSSTLDYGNRIRYLDRMKPVKINSYRRSGSEDDARTSISRAAGRGVAAFHANGCGIGYFLISDGNECGLYFASEMSDSSGFDHYLSTGIPDIMTQNRFVPAPILADIAQYGGVVVNIPAVDAPYLDSILDCLSGMRGVVALLAHPVDATRAQAYRQGLVELYRLSETVGNIDNTFGSGSKRTIKEVVPSVSALNLYLKDQLESRQSGSGMWGCCIWYLAETPQEANNLGMSVTGAIRAAMSFSGSNCQYLETECNPLREGRLGIPTARYDDFSPILPESLEKSPLISILSSEELSSLLQLPLHDHPGINVLNSSGMADAMRPFRVNTGNLASARCIELGTIDGSNQPLRILLDDMTEHVLVTGATGSGKTNTVMVLVSGAHESNIPVCIIEPSKKDYWYLSGTMPDLVVYSAGYDAKRLVLDPFTPERGIILANHVDNLLYAFSGAFEMETPTRLALNGLIKFSYEKLGWSLSDLYYGQAKALPTIGTLIELLPEFMESKLQYGEEVRSNIYGSLLNRLNSLSEGSVGSIVNGDRRFALTGEKLASGTVLIELDDLPIDIKPFITELLLIKLSQYLRRQDASKKLRNLIVLEEAHNVFCDIAPSKREDSKSIASAYFSNLLSEIREYGTGIVIADQGASQINANAISNTKVKIMHALGNDADVEAEAFALQLDDYRKRLLPEFRTGEALVAIRGQAGPWKVAVKHAEKESPHTAACLFCQHKQLCNYAEIDSKLSQNGGRMSITASSILSNPYDKESIARTIESVCTQAGLRHNDAPCVLGYLLDHYAVRCGDREKRRILYFLSEV